MVCHAQPLQTFHPPFLSTRIHAKGGGGGGQGDPLVVAVAHTVFERSALHLAMFAHEQDGDGSLSHPPAAGVGRLLAALPRKVDGLPEAPSAFAVQALVDGALAELRERGEGGSDGGPRRVNARLCTARSQGGAGTWVHTSASSAASHSLHRRPILRVSLSRSLAFRTLGLSLAVPLKGLRCS